MLITARFAGVCIACSKPVLIGDRVDFQRGRVGVEHAACSTEGRAVAEATALSSAIDADIALPCPEGLAYLPYQRAGIAYALNSARKGVLIGDEMGLGKTVQALGVVSASPTIRTVLIVCPASLKLNWRNETQKWLARPARIRVVGTCPNGELLPAVTGALSHLDDVLAAGAQPFVYVSIVNYDMLKALPSNGASPAFDLVVLDEAHYVKNPKALRTQRVVEICKKAGRVLALTGTPIPNKVIEMWPLLQLIAPEAWDAAGRVPDKSAKDAQGRPLRGVYKNVGPGEGAGFFRFARRYCNAQEKWIGRKKVWDFDGASNLAEFQEKLRTSCMVRRLKSEVLTDLPAKRRQVVTVPRVNDREDFGDWAEPDENWRAMAEDITSGKKSLAVGFEDFSRVLKEEAILKVPAVLAHMRECLDGGVAKIILFAHHHEVLDALAEGLADYGCVSLDGRTSVSGRQAAVERFQSDADCRVFIGGIKAAGVGLTLTAASHVVFAELAWVPADLSQAEDRAHRIGQKECVLVQHVVLEGSLDARMTELLTAKQAVADLALDADTILDVSGREVVESAEEKRARALYESKLTESEVSTIHAKLRFLAARCDGAVTEDGVGYNGTDTAFGKQLARCARLTARQALAAQAMLVKYRRQLSEGGFAS